MYYYFFPELPGLLFAAFTVDRIGRKHSMELMFFIGFIFLLPLLSHQSEILTTASLFGSRMFIIGTFTIANIYAPEVHTTQYSLSSTRLTNLLLSYYLIFTPYTLLSIDISYCCKGNWCWSSKLCG